MPAVLLCGVIISKYDKELTEKMYMMHFTKEKCIMQ